MAPHGPPPPLPAPPRSGFRRRLESLGELGLVLIGIVIGVLAVIVVLALAVGPIFGLAWAIYDLVKGGAHLLLDIVLLVALAPYWLFTAFAMFSEHRQNMALIRAIENVLGQGHEGGRDRH